jgi:hypothetical protein
VARQGWLIALLLLGRRLIGIGIGLRTITATAAAVAAAAIRLTAPTKRAVLGTTGPSTGSGSRGGRGEAQAGWRRQDRWWQLLMVLVLLLLLGLLRRKGVGERQLRVGLLVVLKLMLVQVHHDLRAVRREVSRARRFVPRGRIRHGLKWTDCGRDEPRQDREPRRANQV